MDFKHWVNEVKTIPLGDCFRFATMRAVEMIGDGIIPPKDIVVVHAIVHPRWGGNPYPHAWIESRGKCWDWQMRQTKTYSIPVADFYKEYNPTEIKRYTGNEALRTMIKTGHHGPWN
jgi:hypothetical protein